MGQQNPTGPFVQPRPRGNVPLALGGLVLVAAVAAGLWWWYFGSPQPATEHPSLQSYLKGSDLLHEGKFDEAIAALRSAAADASSPQEEAQANMQLAVALFQQDVPQSVSLMAAVATRASYPVNIRARAADLLAQWTIDYRHNDVQAKLKTIEPFSSLSPATQTDSVSISSYEYATNIYRWMEKNLQPTFLSHLTQALWYAEQALAADTKVQQTELAKKAVQEYNAGAGLLYAPEGYLGWSLVVQQMGLLEDAKVRMVLLDLVEKKALAASDLGTSVTDDSTRTLFEANITRLDMLSSQGDVAAKLWGLRSRMWEIIFLAERLPQSAERDALLQTRSEEVATLANSLGDFSGAALFFFYRLDRELKSPALIPAYNGLAKAALISPTFKQFLSTKVPGWDTYLKQ